MTTETETKTETLNRGPKWLSWLPEEERAWLRLRDQIGREVAHRIEHHTVLMGR